MRGTDAGVLRDVLLSDGSAAADVAAEASSSGQSDASGEPDASIILAEPWGLLLDGQGHLYVSDEYVASTVPGGLLRITLATDTAAVIVPSTEERPWARQYLTGDRAGSLFVTTGHGATVLRIEVSSGSVTTLAGSGEAGHADGPGTAAMFRVPTGLVADGKGNLYVAESENHTIRRIVIATDAVTTVAGAPLEKGNVDGVGTAARFDGPGNIAYDSVTNVIYVADTGNHTIRKLDPASRMVTTIAGGGNQGTQSDGVGTAALFDIVGPMAPDGAGNLYVGDRATIRKIALGTGAVTTIAGTAGASASRDGTGTSALITWLAAMELDGQGGLYFSSCQTIRKLDLATGTIVTLYGSPDLAHSSLLGCFTKGRPLRPAAP
jgi:DNA-binding beta-propeller fold protein YncE